MAKNIRTHKTSDVLRESVQSAEMFGTEHISYRCYKKEKDLHVW